MKSKHNTDALPLNLKALFWSYDFEALNATEHALVIMQQILQYGTLSQLRWLITHYGKRVVIRYIEKTPASTLRPQALALLKILLPIRHVNTSFRGAH
ncbi:MAG TPA: hypothetical protein VJH75_04725 [Patescibacteria group bacterium]|nr:hypothetical protein [Patescibacteria group bacterium]